MPRVPVKMPMLVIKKLSNKYILFISISNLYASFSLFISHPSHPEQQASFKVGEEEKKRPLLGRKGGVVQ